MAKRGQRERVYSKKQSYSYFLAILIIVLLIVGFGVYYLFFAQKPLLEPVDEGTQFPTPDPRCVNSNGQTVYQDIAPGSYCLYCDSEGQIDEYSLDGQVPYDESGKLVGNGCQICNGGQIVDASDGSSPQGKPDADQDCAVCEGGFPKPRFADDTDSIDFGSCSMCVGMKRGYYPGDEALDSPGDSTCYTCMPGRNLGGEPGWKAAGESCTQVIDKFGVNQNLPGGTCVLDEHLNLLGEAGDSPSVAEDGTPIGPTKSEIISKIQSALSSKDSEPRDPTSCVCTNAGECNPGDYKKTTALPPKSLSTFGVVQCQGFGTNLQTGEQTCGYWQPEQAPYVRECNPCRQEFSSEVGCLDVDADYIKNYIAGQTACKYKTFFGKIKTGLCTEAGTCKKGCPSGCLYLDAGEKFGQATPEGLAVDAGYDLNSCPLKTNNPLHGQLQKFDYDEDGKVDAVKMYVCF